MTDKIKISKKRREMHKRMVKEAQEYMDPPARNTIEKCVEHWEQIPNDEWKVLCEKI